MWVDLADYVEQVHEAKGVVLHTVGSAAEARQAVACSVDGVTSAVQGAVVGLILSVVDIDAARAELTPRGAEVSEGALTHQKPPRRSHRCLT